MEFRATVSGQHGLKHSQNAQQLPVAPLRSVIILDDPENIAKTSAVVDLTYDDCFDNYSDDELLLDPPVSTAKPVLQTSILSKTDTMTGAKTPISTQPLLSQSVSRSVTSSERPHNVLKACLPDDAAVQRAWSQFDLLRGHRPLVIESTRTAPIHTRSESAHSYSSILKRLREPEAKQARLAAPSFTRSQHNIASKRLPRIYDKRERHEPEDIYSVGTEFAFEHPKERRSLKFVDAPNPQDATRHKASNGSSNRLPPSLSNSENLHRPMEQFHRFVLQLDYETLDEHRLPMETRSLSAVPTTFTSYKHYTATFEPLLRLECYQQLCQAKAEKTRKHTHTLPVPDLIMQLTAIDQVNAFYYLTFTVKPHQDAQLDALSTQDLVLLSATQKNHIAQDIVISDTSSGTSSSSSSSSSSSEDEDSPEEGQLPRTTPKKRTPLHHTTPLRAKHPKNTVTTTLSSSAAVVLRGKSQGKSTFLGRIDTLRRHQRELKIQICVPPGTPQHDTHHWILRSEWQTTQLLSLATFERECDALRALSSSPLLSDLLSARVNGSLGNAPSLLSTSALFNDSQRRAIHAAVHAGAPQGFTLVQGPPGTGKTKTLLGMLGTLIAERRRQRECATAATVTLLPLLVCAPSNAAVDEIVRRLKADGVRDIQGLPLDALQIVRVGTMDSVHPAVRDTTLDYLVDAHLQGTGSGQQQQQQREVNVSAIENAQRLVRLDRDIQTLSRQLSIRMSDGRDGSELEDRLEQLHAQRQRLLQQEEGIENERENRMKEKKKEDNSKKQEGKGRGLRNEQRGGAVALSDNERARHRIKLQLLQSADVLCATLSGSGKEIIAELTSIASTTSKRRIFDTVMIDEAAQAVEPSVLIPLQYGCRRCIMIGDPQQLPATVVSRAAQRLSYEQSLFDRLQRVRPDRIHMLCIQYRMHPEISAFPSTAFYRGLLRDAERMALQKAAVYHQDPRFAPFVFYNVYQGKEQSPQGIGQKKGKGKEERVKDGEKEALVDDASALHSDSADASGGWSYRNPAEVRAALIIVENLVRAYPNERFFHRIAVLSPYKAQVRALKMAFQQHYGPHIVDDMDFQTIDGFQGREKDLVLFSCVRANSDVHHGQRPRRTAELAKRWETGSVAMATTEETSRSTIGFVGDVRRMNVAITRAMTSLWILGHAATLSSHAQWRALLQHAHQAKRLVDFSEDATREWTPLASGRVSLENLSPRRRKSSVALPTVKHPRTWEKRSLFGD